MMHFMLDILHDGQHWRKWECNSKLSIALWCYPSNCIWLWKILESIPLTLTNVHVLVLAACISHIFWGNRKTKNPLKISVCLYQELEAIGYRWSGCCCTTTHYLTNFLCVLWKPHVVEPFKNQARPRIMPQNVVIQTHQKWTTLSTALKTNISIYLKYATHFKALVWARI